MFKSKTLFVVGAGASCEIGLPSGEALKGEIASRVNIRFDDGRTQSWGDQAITQALREHVSVVDNSGDINPYLHAGWHIAKAMPQAISIDNFIEAHQHDSKIELCGKLGIVRSVLEAERQSKIFYDKFNGAEFPSDLGDVWYAKFFQRLTEGVPRESVSNVFNNITIVTFNYDRCIEHFLLNALINYYGLFEEEARTLINYNLKIYHPYGQVGRLPWQLFSAGATEFGGGRSRVDLLEIAKQIKTFTERVEEEETLQHIKHSLAEAEVVVFLGFAFADQNMELLHPAFKTTAKRVYATAYGMSKHDADDVEREIAKLLNRSRTIEGWHNLDIQVRDKTCAQLFREYSRSMAR